jgi:hypothetical protein
MLAVIMLMLRRLLLNSFLAEYHAISDQHRYMLSLLYRAVLFSQVMRLLVKTHELHAKVLVSFCRCVKLIPICIWSSH